MEDLEMVPTSGNRWAGRFGVRGTVHAPDDSPIELLLGWVKDEWKGEGVCERDDPPFPQEVVIAHMIFMRIGVHHLTDFHRGKESL